MGGSVSKSPASRNLPNQAKDAMAAAAAAAAAGTAQYGSNLYANMLLLHNKTNRVTGGGDASSLFNGGGEESKSRLLRDIEDYRSSKAAEFKEGVVRSVARAMKAQGLNVDPDADLDTISGQLRAALKGKNLGSNAKTHESLCKAIAKSLNEQITPGRSPSESLIDTSSGAGSICRSVNDLVMSMTTGMHSEFLAVKTQVVKTMRNLAVLDELLRVTHNKIDDALMKDASIETKREIGPMRDARERLLQEREKVLRTLQGLLDTVIQPASEELELALAEQGELLKDLGNDYSPGTSEFGRQLSAALSGLSVMSGVAARTHQALSQVGSNMSQFANSPDWNKFRDSLNSTKIDDPAKASEVAVALEELKKAFPQRKAIARDADSDVGKLGLDDNLAEEPYFTGEGEFMGGADEPTEVDRRIKKRDLERKLILKQYFERTRAAYDKLLQAVNQVGPRLGKDIPVTAAVKRLRDALERLANASEVRVDFNLIGYYASSEAKSRRQEFLDHLSLIDRSLDELVSGDGGSYFVAMREAIKDIIKIIDYYSEVVKTKIGSGGVSRAAAVGGADMEDELKLAEAARSSIDLKSTINTLVYFIYIAGVRENLNASAKEIDEYGVRYDEVLGDAVAGAIQDLRDEKKVALKTDNVDLTKSLGPDPGTGGAGKVDYDAMKALLENEYKTKEEFYQVLQAVDLYMKAFARGIAQHPDDIADIKRELDGVELIGKWFEEPTGDALCKFFEAGRALGGDAKSKSGAIASPAAPQEHYYDVVYDALAKSEQVATTGAVEAARAKDMSKALDDMMKRMQGLKNLMNSFARIGKKFGGEELATQSFMSPTEMWRRLTNYIKASAISHGVAPGVGAKIAKGDVVQMPATEAGATDEEKKAAFRTCYPTPAADNDALKNCWKRENMFFQYVIKAIAAKILVTIGTYDLFERPEPLFDLTATRMILGGYGEAPEVIPHATELYFRMPRLAEFYRSSAAPSGRSSRRSSSRARSPRWTATTPRAKSRASCRRSTRCTRSTRTTAPSAARARSTASSLR